MRFERGRSREEYLADLRHAAERTWGAERLEPLDAQLTAAAGALWRLAEEPLEPLGPEPDFIGGPPRGRE